MPGSSWNWPGNIQVDNEVTVLPLSRFALYHLEAARTREPQATSTTSIIPVLSQSQAIADNKEEDNASSKLTSFPSFTKLPSSLQHKIWLLFILQNRHILKLELFWKKGLLLPSQPINPLLNISRQIRTDAFSTLGNGLGYVKLQMFRHSPHEKPAIFDFHPRFDMLYVSYFSNFGLKRDSLVPGLKRAGAYNNLRCLAVDYNQQPTFDRHGKVIKEGLEDFLVEFKECQRLELVFIVLFEDDCWNFDPALTKGDGFEVVKPVCRIREKGFLPLSRYGTVLQEMLVRGEKKKVAPRIVFVKRQLPLHK